MEIGRDGTRAIMTRKNSRRIEDENRGPEK